MRGRIRYSLRTAVALALACSVPVFLIACQDGKMGMSGNDAPAAAQTRSPQAAEQQGEMEWASAALGRNPQLELIATDRAAQMFTVRNKQTGEVSAVKLKDLAAAPLAQLSTQPSTPLPTASESLQPELAAAPTRQADQAQGGTSADASATPSISQNVGAEGYKIERSEGQVRVTGPGVSIVTSGSGSESNLQATAQNTVEPIICEGQRMVHFDNREIFVEGNAITVRGGCELHITNSRIVATGTGIVVQDGIVHVSNSHIEGQDGSFDADSRAKVFVRASTFRGLPRRSELALVQDQGGNRWR
jgi:hypothetical protein